MWSDAAPESMIQEEEFLLQDRAFGVIHVWAKEQLRILDEEFDFISLRRWSICFLLNKPILASFADETTEFHLSLYLTLFQCAGFPLIFKHVSLDMARAKGRPKKSV